MKQNTLQNVEFLKVNKQLLNWSGFWFDGQPADRLQRICCFVNMILAVVIILLPESYFIYKNSNDMMEVSRCISEMLSLALAFFKMCWAYHYQEKIRRLVNDMQKAWRECLLENDEETWKKIKFKSNKWSKWLTKGFAYPYLIFASNFMLNPLITTAIMTINRKAKLTLDQLPTPIKFAYPFDEKYNSFTYGITYLIGFSIVISTLTILVGFDTLYLSLMNYCGTFFSLLNTKIKNLDTFYIKSEIIKSKTEWTTKPTLELMREFRSIIKCHNKFIDFANRLEEIINVIMLAQYLSSTFMFCIVGFQLSILLENPYDFFILFTYCCCLCGQLLLFSVFGSQLTEQASEIAYSAYGCGWYNGPLTFQKRISILIQRGQSPLGITAAKFYLISVESFSKVISSSLSYFTLLQTIYEN